MMEGSTGQPLRGIGVLVTRAEDQAEELVSGLESRGAGVYHIPAIISEPIPEPPGLREALRRILEYSHLVFTSAKGVVFFLQHLKVSGPAPQELPPALCVGPRTGDAWRKVGGNVESIPESYTAMGLLDALGEDLSGLSFLVLRPRDVETEVGALLRERGARADEVILYKTEAQVEGGDVISGLLKNGKLDVVLFASPSAIQGVLQMAGGPEKIRNVLALCIGPTTAQAAREAGLRRVVFPDKHTVDGMIDMLLAMAGEVKKRR
jgi:uroporphyrinogen-III synthase